MNTAKALIQNLVQSQPEDATYDEIVRELAFDRMVQRGLEDARKRRVVGNEECCTASKHGRTEVDVNYTGHKLHGTGHGIADDPQACATV